MSIESKNNTYISAELLRYFLYLCTIILCFFLGLGLAHFLGQSIDWWMAISGLSFVLLLFLSDFLLSKYFNASGKIKKENDNKQGKTDHEIRQSRLSAGLATLAVSCVFAYLIIIGGNRSSETITLLLILSVLVTVNVVPPFHLDARGYGELVMTVWSANLVPALAFVTQGNTIHTLLPILTFPLTVFFLATILATSLQGYLNDMVSGRKSLVIMLGWKLAMNAYNWLIILGYLFIAMASLFRLPWSLTWPLFLPAPIFIFTGYEISRIKNGIKPRWPLLALTGYAGAGCMLYLILVTLWV